MTSLARELVEKPAEKAGVTGRTRRGGRGRVAGQAGARADQVERRRQLRSVLVAWLFGAFWMYTITGATLTQFGWGMGLSDVAFGVLAALPFLAGLVQVPATFLQQRVGQRKLIFLVCSILGRLMWGVAAAIPWLLPNSKELWPPLMLTVIFLAWAGGNAGTPPWIDWMADVVPRRVRGRFFALRTRLGLLVGIVTTLGIGYCLDLAKRSHEPDIMLIVSSVLLAIAALVGVMDILCFRTVDDPGTSAPRNPVPFLTALREPLRDHNFRRYLAFNFTFTLGVGFIGQYIWLYLLKTVEFPNWQAQLLLIAVPLMVASISYGLWGRLLDRVGFKPVLVAAGIVVVNGAWGWILVGHGNAWLSAIGYTVALLAMLAWPGVEIANFNIMLSWAGSRQGETFGSAYVALNSVAVALGGMLSGFLGATVAGWLQDFHYLIPVLNIPLTYHGVLFLISTVLRALAIVWACSLTEPRPAATRDAIRGLTMNLYSNVLQAAFLPTRIVGQVYRWSYKLNPSSTGRRPARTAGDSSRG